MALYTGETDIMSLATDARGGAGTTGGSEGAMQARPYNQRIELPSAEDLSDWEERSMRYGGGAEEDDCIHGLDEDELTRDRVKKAAKQVEMQTGIMSHTLHIITPPWIYYLYKTHVSRVPV